MSFWDFTYEPVIIESEIIMNRVSISAAGAVSTVTETTTQVDVLTNWGQVAQLAVVLLLTYSVCLVVTKLVTVWKRGS